MSLSRHTSTSATEAASVFSPIQGKGKGYEKRGWRKRKLTFPCILLLNLLKRRTS